MTGVEQHYTSWVMPVETAISLLFYEDLSCTHLTMYVKMYGPSLSFSDGVFCNFSVRNYDSLLICLTRFVITGFYEIRLPQKPDDTESGTYLRQS